MKKYIIFGAGINGKELLKHVPKERIVYFCDNDPEKVDKKIEGIEIISFEKMKELTDEYTIILASYSNRGYIRDQFERNGITNYIEYASEAYINGKRLTIKQDEEWFSKSKINALLNEYIEKSKSIDWISDFYSCCEIVEECTEKLEGEYAFFDTFFSESTYYGHGKALMDYAGIPYSQFREFPIVAHGTGAGRFPARQFATILNGEFERRIYNKQYPLIPIFTVGPYIRYAKGIIPKNEVEEKKGTEKNALIFVTHNTEKTFECLQCTDEDIIQRIDYYCNRGLYDKVTVCAYWCDIGLPLYRKLYTLGFDIACAGFRFDDRFINRLRTLFDLADDVIVLGFSSSLIHGVALNKDVFYEPIKSEVDYSAFPKYGDFFHFDQTDEYKRIERVFLNGTWKNKEEGDDYGFIDDMYGFSIFRSPEEIKMMFDISSDIWNECDGDMRDYSIGVIKTYQKYRYNYDFDKLSILTKATSHRIIND